MNYLSHYYIDNKPGNHYFNSALFLPDFARNVARRFETENLSLTPNQVQLQLGCKAHLAADKLFHPSPFFINYSHIINEALNNYEPLAHIKRKWFLAHILFEMMLDRVIVKHYENVCHSFYNDLSHVDTNTISSFIKQFAYKDTRQFMLNYNHFCKVKYLFGYAADHSFIYSIGNVYKHATSLELTMSDKLNLNYFINLIEQKYFNKPMIILAELKNVFLNNEQ